MAAITPEDKLKCILNFKEHLVKIRKKSGRRYGIRVYWRISRYLKKFDPSNLRRNMKLLLFT
jgi:hypothetical protein